MLSLPSIESFAMVLFTIIYNIVPRVCFSRTHEPATWANWRAQRTGGHGVGFAKVREGSRTSRTVPVQPRKMEGRTGVGSRVRRVRSRARYARAHARGSRRTQPRTHRHGIRVG